jgi:hypothetical protein
MAALWLWAGVSVLAIVASLGWAAVHRQRPWRVRGGVVLAAMAVISLGFAIYGMTAFCDPPPGHACL